LNSAVIPQRRRDMYHTSLVSEKVDLSSITKKNIRQAFIVNLPFRVRVSTELKLEIGGEESAVVIFRNEVDIPDKESWDQMHTKIMGNWDSLWTKCLIILNTPTVKRDELKAIKDGGEIKVSGNTFSAFNSLNRAILSYTSATKELFGGNPIQLLTDTEYFGCLEWEVDLILEENTDIDLDIVDEIFNLTPEKRMIMGGQYWGTLEDLPKEKLDKVGSYIEKTNNCIFYEFAFRAKSKMVDRDFIGALLMSVVALEGVHAAYLRKHLSEKLSDLGNKSQDLISNYLREQGFYVLIQMSPHLYLPLQNKPEKEIMSKCLKGITMRNSIMHALTNSKGEYKVEGYKNNDICDCYSAVLKVYDCFLQAYEEYKVEL
jgi:hypothetical protein